MSRAEFKAHLMSVGWPETDAENEAASIYDDPKPGDSQDMDGDSFP
jgi:hypothetical protein